CMSRVVSAHLPEGHVLFTVIEHLVYVSGVSSFFLLVLPQPRSTLFPYTTLFRSTPCESLTALSTPQVTVLGADVVPAGTTSAPRDRKSTRLNSSHVSISYAVFCLKKKKSQHRLLVHGPAVPQCIQVILQHRVVGP